MDGKAKRDADDAASSRGSETDSDSDDSESGAVLVPVPAAADETALRAEDVERAVAAMLRDTNMSESWRESGEGKSDAAVRVAYTRALVAASSSLSDVAQARGALDDLISESEAEAAERATVAAELKQSLLSFIVESAVASRDSRGRALPHRAIEQFREQSAELDDAIDAERRTNLRLRQRVRALDGVIKKRDAMRDGLHMIDFEQIKIENQTFTEKIEERNEELSKLRKKIDSTIQARRVMTHVKEKLTFVEDENTRLNRELADTEKQVETVRDALATHKIDRDALRSSNVRLQEQNGLVGAIDLLRDFERNKMALHEARQKFDELRALHTDISARIASGVARSRASSSQSPSPTRRARTASSPPPAVVAGLAATIGPTSAPQTEPGTPHVRFPAISPSGTPR
eukprot:m51a1_g3613 hypothetical protein (404) ;mRNA; f:60437-62402